MTGPDALLEYRAAPGRDSLVRLLESVQDSVYNLCFHVLRRPADAEDAAQEVLLKLLDALPGLKSPDHLRHWLHRVCLTTSLDLVRGHRRRAEREKTVTTPEPGLSDDDRRALIDHLTRLDEPLRAAIIEHFFERRTLDAMARARGCSAPAVWKTVQRATTELRQSLTLAGLASLGVASLPCLEALLPVTAPHSLVHGAVLAKVLSLGSAAPAALGGFLMSAKSNVMIVVLTAALTTGAVALARSSRREAPPRASQPAVVPPIRLDAAIADLEAEGRRLRAERDALATPAFTPAPIKPATIDWAALLAAVDWTRLAALNEKGAAMTPSELEERNKLHAKAYEVTAHVRELNPVAFGDQTLVVLLCVLATGPHRDLLDAGLSAARASIDDLLRAPDAMAMENQLKVIAIRRDLDAFAKRMHVDGPAVGGLLAEFHTSMALLPARDKADAVDVLVRHWMSGLAAPETCRERVRAIAAPFIEAWFANETNATCFSSGQMMFGGGLDQAEAMIRAQLKMQRELLAILPVSEKAAQWLGRQASRFTFQKE